MGNRKQLSALTSLKGLFILVVCLHNSMLIHPVFASVPGASFIRLFGGQLANSMFFILSGFLMAYSYRDAIRSGAVSFGSFLGKRLSKLYPLFFVTNAAALLMAVIQYGPSAVNLQRIAFTFLLQNGGGMGADAPYNSPTWFVSALLVCYAVFFFICCFSRNHTAYCVAVAVGIVWGHTLLRLDTTLPFCHPENGVAFMNFFIGCALAELNPLLEKNYRKWHPPVALAVLAVCLYLPLRYGVEIICGDVQSAFAFVICPLIVYLALAEGLCSRILQQKIFVALGSISMPLFFWHLVAYQAFDMVLARVRPGTVMDDALYFVYGGVLLVWCILSDRIFKSMKRK